MVQPLLRDSATNSNNGPRKLGQKTVFFPGPSEVSHNDWMCDSRDLFSGQSVVLRLPKDLILHHLCLLE